MGVAGCITLLVEAAAIREYAFILQHCLTGCYLSKKHPWEWRELRGSSRALHCDMMISATLWLILQVLWVLNIRKCNRMVYSWDMLKLENSQCYKPNVFITFHRTLFIYFFTEILWERTDWRKLSLAAEKATGLGCLTVMQLWHWSANKCDLWWSVMWGSVGGCDLLREERD